MNAVVSARPWHLLPVALCLVLWHGVLALDYVNARFDLYPEFPGLMAGLPLTALWLKVVWGMAVWLGLLGAVFLVWGDDAAVLLLFAAAVAMLAAMIGLGPLEAPAALSGVAATAPWPLAPAALVAVPLLGWIYARGLKRRGRLH
ncbi:MAG: hypothetical protein HLUCCA12_10615 [Rhodobacteraceae bacterium HLUCCA12]|nr:MAG: hypothetical protein HLUCCA12_10615 [Rhodobacteraceae bacterium HLUCCA12]